jgi:hypothetical protein
MATLNPNLFDKMQPYLMAITKCAGAGSGSATFKNIKEKDCATLVKMYLDMNNYTETPSRKKGVFPYQLLNAYMAVLKRLKYVDPPRRTQDIKGLDLAAALKEIVFKDGVAATMAAADEGSAKLVIQSGGGEDLNKIIKLSKSEVSGFVPYHVNNITGSYTEDYLNSLNSRIRKIDSQFGGFKKVTRDVIGSVEDLDRILRADLENQIDNSVFKRYYKTYSIMSQKGGSKYIKEIWDWYHTKATVEEKQVFDAYAEFVIEETGKTDTLATGRRSSKPTKDDDLKNGFLRVNLRKAEVVDLNTYAADYKATKTAKKGTVPLILLVLPGNTERIILDLIFNFWYSDEVDIAADLDTTLVSIGGNAFNTSKANVINPDPPGLNDDGVMSCDDKVLKSLITENNNLDDDGDDGINPFTSKYNKDFKDSGPGLLKNGWRWDRSTNTVQKKEKGKWVDYNPIENPDEFKKIFNAAGKCFNSFIEFRNKKQCCNLIQLLADGDTEKFFNAVREDDVTINQLDTGFTEVNPITVVKMLEAFKFTKQKTWIPVHGMVYKFPNWNWWSKNVIKTSDLSELEQKKILNKTNLKDVLDMSVAFVNNNLNLLNPHITYDNTSMTNSITDEKLAAIKIPRFIPRIYSDIYQGNWWNVTGNKLIRSSIGGLSHNKNMPLYPLLGGQHFVLSGGSNKKTEIVLDNTEIIPQFATQICNDLKLLIETLKSKNKTLSSKEMENLNKELEQFREAEVNLINKVLLINKYIKVANLLPNNEREILSENKINKLISEYYENFKDYADKDLELKGIGSYIRSILSDGIDR